MRMTSWKSWLSKSMVLVLVCGFVAAVPLDARADWHDQYGTVVVYGSNGGSAGRWVASTSGSHGSSGGSWGSSGGSSGGSIGGMRARRAARRASRHGSSGGSWGSSGGSWGSHGSWGS